MGGPRQSDVTLITGAGGFLGAHVLAAAFARAQAQASSADSLGSPVVGTCRRPDEAPHFTTPRDGARWVAADFEREGTAAALLEELQPTHVVHCAANASVTACERAPDAARRLNTALPREIARWCAGRGARVVHVSTDLVFGADAPPATGFAEQQPPAPVSVYGRTKADAEAAVLEAYTDSLVVRLPLLYGNSGGRGRGASDWLLEEVDSGAQPALFVDEWRTPLEVTNAAEALIELLFGDERGILHVAGPDRVNRHELGLWVLAAMEVPEGEARDLVRAAFGSETDAPELRPADVSVGDASRLRRATGWRPEIPIAQTLERMLDYWREQTSAVQASPEPSRP